MALPCLLMAFGGETGAPLAPNRPLDASDVCSQGPTAPPSLKTGNLDRYAADWGVYCEGAPEWIKMNVSSPALDSESLQCSLTGGAPYSNAHFYREFTSQPAATAFTYNLYFRFSSTTCNNDGNPSSIQAIEFSMNKWHRSRRYEFALQWQNVGPGAPQWRYWDPHRHKEDRWVSFEPPQAQCLPASTWHRLTLYGRIMAGKVYYDRFRIDGTTRKLGIMVSAASAPDEPDRLAIAVQLDGNFNEDPYDVFLDKVRFIRKPGR